MKAGVSTIHRAWVRNPSSQCRCFPRRLPPYPLKKGSGMMQKTAALFAIRSSTPLEATRPSQDRDTSRGGRLPRRAAHCIPVHYSTSHCTSYITLHHGTSPHVAVLRRVTRTWHDPHTLRGAPTRGAYKTTVTRGGEGGGAATRAPSCLAATAVEEGGGAAAARMGGDGDGTDNGAFQLVVRVAACAAARSAVPSLTDPRTALSSREGARVPARDVSSCPTVRIALPRR